MLYHWDLVNTVSLRSCQYCITEILSSCQYCITEILSSQSSVFLILCTVSLHSHAITHFAGSYCLAMQLQVQKNDRNSSSTWSHSVEYELLQTPSSLTGVSRTVSLHRAKRLTIDHWFWLIIAKIQLPYTTTGYSNTYDWKKKSNKSNKIQHVFRNSACMQLIEKAASCDQ